MARLSSHGVRVGIAALGFPIVVSMFVLGCTQQTYTREDLEQRRAKPFDGVVVTKGGGYFVAADRVGITTKFYVSRFDTEYLPEKLSLARLREGDDIRMYYIDKDDKFDKRNYFALQIHATRNVGEDFKEKATAINKYHGARPLDPVEGIWAFSDSKYEVMITKDIYDEFSEYDYVGFVLSAESGIWRPGQIKVLLKSTAKKNTYPAKYIKDDHSGLATTFVMDDCNIMEAVLPTGQQGKERVEEFFRLSPQPVGGVTRGSRTGTAFLISGRHAVTNYHVVEGLNKVKLKFSDGTDVEAKVDIYDRFNDLAVLVLEKTEGLPPPLPIADSVCLVGQKVFAFGYPMPSLMGDEVKYTDGSINSLSGFDNDPRLYQVSAQIQAGNSGGPLMNFDGEVVGIMAASLNAVNVFHTTGDIPQNVNYAVKSSYIRSLLDSRPDKIDLAKALEASTDERMISEVKRSVALVVVGE